MKVCERCGDEIVTRDGENRCPACDDADGCASQKAAERRKRAREARRMRDEAMRALGLRKVRGAMGGTYWE